MESQLVKIVNTLNQLVVGDIDSFDFKDEAGDVTTVTYNADDNTFDVAGSGEFTHIDLAAMELYDLAEFAELEGAAPSSKGQYSHLTAIMDRLNQLVVSDNEKDDRNFEKNGVVQCTVTFDAEEQSFNMKYAKGGYSSFDSIDLTAMEIFDMLYDL